MAFTVLTAEFSHETNTSSQKTTDYEAFVEYFFSGTKRSEGAATLTPSSPASAIVLACLAGSKSMC